MSEEYAGLPGYDLIGDIHGYAGKLKKLLDKLGYSVTDGVYSHPQREVIFLGDFIDRGPGQREVLDIVMAMVKTGAAQAVMGNHEFNALAFHTPHPTEPNDWLRPRTNRNVKQHDAFLKAYEGDEVNLKIVMSFFWSLPLWLELDGIRVVHACWEQNHVDQLGSPVLTADILVRASSEGTIEYNAIEALLKGIEHQLPAGQTFNDKDGHQRDAVRLKWWVNEESRLADVVMPPGTLDHCDAKDTVLAKGNLTGYHADHKPVFIGHYWMQADKEQGPHLLADNVACIDFSVAKNGHLAAYRWSGEAKLKRAHFEYV